MHTARDHRIEGRGQQESGQPRRAHQRRHGPSRDTLPFDLDRIVVLGCDLDRSFVTYLSFAGQVCGFHRRMAQHVDLARNTVAALEQTLERAARENRLDVAALRAQLALDVLDGLLRGEWVQYAPGRDALVELAQMRLLQAVGELGLSDQDELEAAVVALP